MKQVYLDNAGSTKVDLDVLTSFNKICESYYANCSASHDLGNYNNNIFKEAKKQVASLCVVSEDEVFFTSGASESINTAIKGVALYNKKRLNHIVTTTLEHPATYNTLNYLETRFGFKVTRVKPVFGKITADMICDAITPNTVLVSMIHVQSETGLVLPVEDVAYKLKNSPVTLHVDACQSFGKLTFDISNIDLLSVSFHKLHGIKGSGLLLKKNGLQMDSIIHGGSQQTIRSGTIPLELVVAGVKTLKVAFTSRDESYFHVLKLWNYLYDKLSVIEDIKINSIPNNSPYIFNFSILNINTSALSRALYEKNIYVATNTSCASSSEYSMTIFELTNSMELAKGAIRVSFSKYNTMQEIDYFISELIEMIKKVRSNSCG